MKSLNLYIGLLFLLLCSACTDKEDFIKNVNGDKVTLKLDFNLQGGKEIVVGRATSEQENKLYDLHFYVFNAEGRLTGYEKVLSEDENGVTQDIPSQGTVYIRTKNGASYIYALANINKSTTYFLNEADLDLLNVTEGGRSEDYWSDIDDSELTRERFLGMQFRREYGDENNVFSPDPAGNVFMMSGYANDGKMVNISIGTDGNAVLPSGQNVVKLYRILSKIEIRLDIDLEETNATFTPKYYRLCNVPIAGRLVPKAGISNNATYLADNNVTVADVESSYRWNFDGNDTISFYYPENLQVAKNNSIPVWKDREKNSWVENTKTFTNAADNAAYIEIYGDYLSQTGTGAITASVGYTIHFGDFGHNLTDYNLIRNYAYTYNVKVKGVDDIEVEAKKTGDNPHAEGMIVDATAGKHFEVDAHYEARVLSFKKSIIESLKAKNPSSGYILSVKTPFGETNEIVNVKDDGVYDIHGVKKWGFDDVRSLFKNEADYEWIKFVKNYYEAPAYWWGSAETNLVNGSDVSKSVCKYPGDNNPKCLNIFQLLAELYNDDTYTDNNGTEAHYTCFIDENYYANKPWPDYVNKEPRTMLIANELDVSNDGQSLYAKVAYSISQRSISTFYTTDYKPDNINLVKAFGTETFDEEKIHNKRFNNGTIGTINNTHDWNARTSAVSTNQNQNWYDGMNIVEGTQPMYDRAAKACMSRNRDTNGDEKIGEDEVKWYLAAVDQYRALFFGQNALNPDAYLISNADLAQINLDFGSGWDENDPNGHSYRSRYHYFTCSGGNKTTFWPEEGLTNNPMANKDNDYWVSEAQLVRCVRTLVSGGDGLENPQKFYTYNKNTKTFNLGGIKATRNHTEEPLEIHNEIEGSNNLYSSFVVANNDLAESWYWNGYGFTYDYDFYLRDVTGNEVDPCSGYKDQTSDNLEKQYSWRTPNQKEIALMVAPFNDNNETVLDSNLSYATRTKFSGSDAERGYWRWHNTPGFWTTTQRINVGGQGEEATENIIIRIRCVRDYVINKEGNR